MLQRTPFLKSLEEVLIIRRPNPRERFGFDIRGRFRAIVNRQQFSVDDAANLNLTDIVFQIAPEGALPTRALTDSTDPNYEKDIQKNDHLIRLKFFTDTETDTELKLKGLRENIVQVVDFQVYEDADVMVILAKELGSL